LTGLLFGFSLGFSRGALPNVFLEKSFLNKKQRSRSRFGEATICGFTEMAPAPLKKLLLRSPAKQVNSMSYTDFEKKKITLGVS
jgi:hypothetical protein